MHHTSKKMLRFALTKAHMGTVLLGIVAAPVWAASVPCTPSVGYDTCAIFTYSGGDQSFVVPANA